MTKLLQDIIIFLVVMCFLVPLAIAVYNLHDLFHLFRK